MTTLQESMNEVMHAAIEPRWEAIKRIALDGDVAIVIHEPTEVKSTRVLLATLRGSDGKDVMRLTRTRAARVFAGDARTLRWTTARVPSGHTRVFLWTRRTYFLLNHTRERSWWLEPGTWLDPAAPGAQSIEALLAK